MSDEDDDYMSAAFLNITEDVRPGLVCSNTLKRKYEIEKKAVVLNKQQRTKPLRQLEEEHRNAGLDTALTTDNKGFLMLQKMGYKPGMKLGVPQKDSSCAGLSEPIKVQVKKDRGGLGREEEIRKRIVEKEKKKKTIKVWKENETARLTEEYRQRMRDKIMQKHLASDLNKIRKVCEQLDNEEGIEEPMRTWFWFTEEEQQDDEDDTYEDDLCGDDSTLNPEDQLYFINEYLRSKYFYCVWCGTRFTDENDMESNCPGAEKEDHE